MKTTDGKTYTGTVDLTKATGVLAPDSATLQKAAGKANAIPFTATVDDKGRLTDVKIDAGSIDPTLSTEVSFTGFETAADVSSPADADVVEATASVLKLFEKS